VISEKEANMSEMISTFMEADRALGSGLFVLSSDERQLKYGSLKRIVDAVKPEQLEMLKRYSDALNAFFTHMSSAEVTDEERTRAVLLKTTLFAEAEHYADCLILFREDMNKETPELEGDRLEKWRSEQAKCHDTALNTCEKIAEIVKLMPDFSSTEKASLLELGAIDRVEKSVDFNKYLLLLAHSDVIHEETLT
jgi:hypothetical protein